MGETLLILAIALASAVAGLLLGHSLILEPAYRDPQLHAGRWDLQTVHNGNVRWKRLEGLHRPIPHSKGQHYAVTCDIMRGLAHVDTCECGAKRYGVFGLWSLPPT